MNRSSALTTFAVLAGVVVLLGGAGVLAPALLVDRHNGDMMHLMDMVLRMADGQMPHLDFVTPIGILSIWPIAAFVKAGVGVGHAVILAQLSLALVLLVPTWWVAENRFNGFWAAVFGGSVMVLCLAMIHGESGAYLSMSMHYNRWAWALAFLAVAIGFLPAHRPERWGADAIILGIAMALLVLVKVTFVVALAGPIIVMMLLRRDCRRLLGAVAVATLTLLVALAVLGLDFWLGYASDLLSTAGSELREYPGLEPSELASTPAYVTGSILMLAAVVVLRTGGRPQEGLGLLLLLPAVIYVTAQNFGNDPKWMWLVGLAVLALRPDAGRPAIGGIDARLTLTVIAAGLMFSVSPSFINMFTSPIRNLAEDQSKYMPVLAGDPVHSDYRGLKIAVLRYDLLVPGDTEGTGMEWAREGADREEPTVFLGEQLDECSQASGLIAAAQGIADDLVSAGYDKGQQIMNADVLNIYWLLNPDLAPLKGGAPWPYSGLPGWEATEFVLVPRCPVHPAWRKHYIDEISERIEAGEAVLEEVRRTPLYTLYSKRDLQG